MRILHIRKRKKQREAKQRKQQQSQAKQSNARQSKAKPSEAKQSQASSRCGGLVHLHTPLASLLQPRNVFVIVEALLLADTLKHVLDARHHALEPAEVHDGAFGEAVEDLVGILFDLVLDVHLSTLGIGLLATECIVEFEIVGVLGLYSLPLLIVEKCIRISDAEEEPGHTLVSLARRRCLCEQTPDEAAVWRNACAGRDHDVIRVRLLLRHEHNLAC